jgi:hypothetical protein
MTHSEDVPVTFLQELGDIILSSRSFRYLPDDWSVLNDPPVCSTKLYVMMQDCLKACCLQDRVTTNHYNNIKDIEDAYSEIDNRQYYMKNLKNSLIRRAKKYFEEDKKNIINIWKQLKSSIRERAHQ